MINIEKYKKNIPMELRDYKQWLWFKKITKIDANGMEKTLKLPISPITLKSTDWNNKNNWADFETAVNQLESSGVDGLSFVLSEDDPFLCIDLDDVSEKMKKRVCLDFHSSYIERSQSRKGLHIFVKAKIPKDFNNQEEKVEIYTKNRCIAMTGDILSSSKKKVKYKQNEVDKYYREFAPKKSITRAIKNYRKMEITNLDVPDMYAIIETMRKYNAKACGLFDGCYSTGDASKDDFRLLLFLNSFTHGNEALMKEIFLLSSLNRMKDRSKRKNETAYIKYVEDSIKKAIQYGNKDYWNYNYHRKSVGDARE